MAKSATASGGALVDAKKWKNASMALNQVSDAYRAAAASSGLLTASQIKSRPQVEKNIELLQKNKLALNDVFTRTLRWKSAIRELYREQLRLQRMTVTSRGRDMYGRNVMDITVPNTVPRDLDTMANKLRLARTLTHSVGVQMTNLGKNTQWAGRQITVGLTYPMILFGAATAKMAYDVDKQLVRIQKVYDSVLGPEATMLEKARESTMLRADSYALAADMAKKYGAAATDVLQIEAELAATGVNGQNLLTSTSQTTRIAALGELDWQQAVDMTVALQNAFKDTIRTSDDLGRAFDMMNAVENATSLSIQDIAEATPRAASALAGLGVTVDEMTVLLTSMRSAGIDAAEGANALKSVSARIINPGVLKQAQPFFDGFANLEELSKKSGGNLYKFMQELAKATQGMSNYAKQQGLVKLFGAWQFNRGAAALKGVTDAMFDLGDTSSQTARAIKATQMSAEELAAIADGEIAKKMNSMSGKFKASWEQLKLVGAEMGEAFLPVMTSALTTVTKIGQGIIKIFESLPERVAKMIGVAAGFAALIGPTLMFAGIFLNMLGYITRWGGMIISLPGKMKVVTAAQQAATIYAEQAAKAYGEEAYMVSVLTQELQALAAAQGYSMGVGQVAMATPAARGGVYASAGEIPLPKGYTSKTIDTKTGPRTNYYNPQGKVVAGDTIPAVRQWKAEQELIKKSTAASVKNMGKAGAEAEKTALASGKVNKQWTGAKMSALAMSAAFTASIIPGAEKFSGYMMNAAFALTGVATAKDLWVNRNTEKAIAQRAATAAAEQKAMAAGAAAGATAATRWGKVGALIKKAGLGLMSFTRFLGPAGIAITAAAAGLFIVYKKSQESSKLQESMNSSAEKWADALGGVAEQYKEISRLASDVNSEGISAADLAKEFTKDDSPMKDIVETFKRVREDGNTPTGDSSEFDMRALDEYIKMIDKTNLSAQDAKVGLEGMFLAAGYAAGTARTEAEKYFDLIGDKVSDTEYQMLWSKQIKELFTAGGDFDDRVEGMAKQIGDSLAKMPNAIRRGGYLNRLQGSLDNEMSQVITSSLDSGTKNALRSFGIDNNGEIAQAVANWNKVISKEMTDTEFLSLYGIDKEKDYQKAINLISMMTNMANNTDIQKVMAAEAMITEELAKQYGITLDIYNIENLLAALRNDNYAVNKTDAEAAYRRRIMLESIASSKGLTKEQQLQILNEERIRYGLKETVYLSDLFRANTKGTRMAEKELGDEVKRTTAQMRKRQALQKWLKNSAADAYQSGWQSVAGAVASEAQETLQAQQSAAMDALDATFDREEQALDRRADYWDKFYDNAIDKANAYYDNRIEKINNSIAAEEKANDIRQRIFDAEQRRLQRMAEMQNNNIDFNMLLNQGKLDEAAKLMNDAQAKNAALQMEDEQRKADYELQARRESLEKQIDLLEKQRDRRVKALEDARQAKQKAIEIARQKVQAENEIERRGLEQRQAMQSKYYQMALDELNAYIPTSQADLERHIKYLNKRYEKYGVKLETMGSEWGKYIAEQHTLQMAIAANNLKSEVNWAGAGFDAAEGMMQGMAASLGMSVAQFKKWLGLKVKQQDRPKGSGWTSSGDPRLRDPESRHGGGAIGGPGSKRTGYTGNYSRDEVMVNAQRGEYMMSKSATQKYGVDFFDRINDGRLSPFGIGGISGFTQMLPFLARSMYEVISRRSQDTLSKMKVKGRKSGVGKFKQGPGGRHSILNGRGVITQGIHPNNAIDIGVPVGTPVYSVADGRVIKSYDIRGYEPRQPDGGNGYRSYGRVIAIDHGGFSSLMAHLSRRNVSTGQLVKGGTRIGLSGDTGNSSGPHLHLEGHGASPYTFLRQGGQLRYDNTLVMGHRKETMLSAPLSQAFKEGVKNLGSGGGDYYYIDLSNCTFGENADITKAMDAWWKDKNVKRGHRRVVKSR